MINYRFFNHRDDLAHELAVILAETLRAACPSGGKAVFVASGGNSPVNTYRKLSKTDLSWENMIIIPSDERWVAPDHPESNENMLRRELLRSKAASARLISLITGDKTPEKAEAAIENRIKELPCPWDIVLTGMGEDGHIASLFPYVDEPAQTLDLSSEKLCRATRCAYAVYPRITLTAGALLHTRRLILLFFGDRKRRTFEEALNGTDVRDKPVRLLIHQEQVPLDVYWAP